MQMQFQTRESQKFEKFVINYVNIAISLPSVSFRTHFGDATINEIYMTHMTQICIQIDCEFLIWHYQRVFVYNLNGYFATFAKMQPHKMVIYY